MTSEYLLSCCHSETINVYRRNSACGNETLIHVHTLEHLKSGKEYGILCLFGVYTICLWWYLSSGGLSPSAHCPILSQERIKTSRSGWWRLMGVHEYMMAAGVTWPLRSHHKNEPIPHQLSSPEPIVCRPFTLYDFSDVSLV